MSKKRDRKGNGRNLVVVQTEEVVEGGHHGGAWKVAYADFVTAMMAFFLLMWLLNATTEEQRRGLADYFSPHAVLARAQSGNGQPLGGKTPFDNGSMVSDLGVLTVMPGIQNPHPDVPDDPADAPAAPAQAADDADGTGQAGTSQAGAGQAETSRQAGAASSSSGTAGNAGAAVAPAVPAARPEAAASAPVPVPEPPKPEPKPAPAPTPSFDAAQQERQALERAAKQIGLAIRGDPKLAELSHQLAIDMTPEGLRIQLLDEERKPMFATGSATLDERARLLLQKIAPILQQLPEGISIAGHTDATPYRGTDRTNWELSSERANATRRLLVESGLPESRIRSITGNADRDPLLPKDPFAAANRRIAILVLRQAPAPQPDAGHAPPASVSRAAAPATPQPAS